MKKYIKNFDSIDAAKEATLYSPLLMKISEGEESNIFTSVTGEIDTELEIKGDSLGDITIEEKPRTFEFYIEDIPYYAEEGMTWGNWCDSEYNTDGYYVSDGLILVESGSEKVTLDGQDVIVSDVIYIYHYNTVRW